LIGRVGLFGIPIYVKQTTEEGLSEGGKFTDNC
jgi:hypothetical protein